MRRSELSEASTQNDRHSGVWTPGMASPKLAVVHEMPGPLRMCIGFGPAVARSMTPPSSLIVGVTGPARRWRTPCWS